MTTVDLDISEEELERYSEMAHESELTLNEFILRAVYTYLIRRQQDELDGLKARMAEAVTILESVLPR